MTRRSLGEHSFGIGSSLPVQLSLQYMYIHIYVYTYICVYPNKSENGSFYLLFPSALPRGCRSPVPLATVRLRLPVAGRPQRSPTRGLREVAGMGPSGFYVQKTMERSTDLAKTMGKPPLFIGKRWKTMENYRKIQHVWENSRTFDWAMSNGYFDITRGQLAGQRFK